MANFLSKSNKDVNIEPSAVQELPQNQPHTTEQKLTREVEDVPNKSGNLYDIHNI